MSIANIKSLHYDAHVKYHRRASGSAVKMKYFLTHNERRALVEEVGVSCLVLFEYYLRLASTENAPITDVEAADYFGWNERAAMRHRLKLVKHGWVDIQQATLNNGRKVYFYYLGKEEVAQSGFCRAQLASDKIALPSVD